MDDKRCSKCGETKKLSEYNHDKNAKGGYSYWCRGCSKDAQKKGRNREGYKELNTQRGSLYKLKKMGISKSEYDYILQVQVGRCAICHEEEKTGRLCVDHDHITGRNRGLLCKKCNLAIGHLKDSPVLALSASRYLILHSARGVKWSLFFSRIMSVLNDFLDVKVNNNANSD